MQDDLNLMIEHTVKVPFNVVRLPKMSNYLGVLSVLSNITKGGSMGTVMIGLWSG